MPNRNYNNGANLERRLMKRLTDEGYYCVRSAGSHGAVDVVAMNSKEVMLIQAKNFKLSPSERKEAIEKFYIVHRLLGGDSRYSLWLYERIDRMGVWTRVVFSGTDEDSYLTFSTIPDCFR